MYPDANTSHEDWANLHVASVWPAQAAASLFQSQSFRAARGTDKQYHVVEDMVLSPNYSTSTVPWFCTPYGAARLFETLI